MRASAAKKKPIPGQRVVKFNRINVGVTLDRNEYAWIIHEAKRRGLAASVFMRTCSLAAIAGFDPEKGPGGVASL